MTQIRKRFLSRDKTFFLERPVMWASRSRKTSRGRSEGESDFFHGNLSFAVNADGKGGFA